MKNIFVYGSLKKGFFNHEIINENPRNRFIKNGVICGYNLFLLYSYPGIKASSSNDKVYVELYSLTDEVFDRIDRLERRANYTPVEVEDEDGKSGTIYVYNGDVDKSKIIPFGKLTKDDEKLKIAKEENGE